MKKVCRQHKGFSLEVDTITDIKLKAVQEGINDSRALDMIVEEWSNFKADKDLPQQDTSEDLETIKKRLSRLEMIVDYRAYQSYDVIKSFFPPLLEEESE